MMDFKTGKERMRTGVSFVASGDHQVHHFSFGEDIDITIDHTSIITEIPITERQAENLYWWLLETIPQLRKDRR
jgi:hypothetical protein